MALGAGLMLCVSLMMAPLPSFATEAQPLAAEKVTNVIFPDDKLATKEGAGFAVAEQERAMVINFWATWCAPCVTELPELAEAARLLAQGDEGEQIDVVLISVDRKGAAHAQAFLDERGIDDVISAYNPLSDWPRSLGLRGLPSTYLISADKQNIYLVSGPAHWADEAVIAQIRSLILAP